MKKVLIEDGPSKWDLQVATFGTGPQAANIPMYILINTEGKKETMEVLFESIGRQGRLVSGVDFQLTLRTRWTKEIYTGTYNTSTRTGEGVLTPIEK